MKTLRIKSLIAILVSGWIAFAMQVMANPVSWQQAQLNVHEFLQQHGKAVTAPSLRYASTVSTADWYVFNIGDNEGYVIASGDDLAPAILGYADEGSLDMNNPPENLRWWLDEYARQIRFMRDNGLSASHKAGKSPAQPAIAPLMTSRWNQTAPYNRYCPLDTNGRRCVTGCVATAMAQVMYYHRTNSVAETIQEIPAYVTSNGVVVDAIPAGSSIDWDNMVDAYNSSIATTEEQKDAVAHLMRYCGSSVLMDYSSGSSSAYSARVAPALVAFFNYSSRTKYRFRNNCGLTDEEWEDFIYNELSNSRPVYYSGVSSTNVAHAFVCDGYDGDGFFHLNWGWGSSGAYFRLSAIDGDDTSLLTYSHYHEVVAFAEPRTVLPSPDAGVHFADPIAKAVCLMSGDVNDDGALDMDEVLAVTELEPFNWLKMDSFDEFQLFIGVTSIPDKLFEGCEYMESITLPDSVKTIGEYAFKDCRSLKEITIPESVTSVGIQMFTGCSSLKHIIWNAKKCSPTVLPVVNAAAERLTFGDAVQLVPNNFAKNSNLKYLTLGDSITKIASNAFYHCTGLKRVVIPNSVTVIAQQAFFENTGLESVTFGNALATIGDRSFNSCSALTEISIPNSVTKIGMYAFNGCTRLESVTIGNSVKTISSRAFAGCDSLKVVTCLIPQPLTINANVFNDLYGQATLRVPMGAVDAYRAASPWNQFYEIVGIDPADGDVNLDGRTDIADVTGLINQLLTATSTEYSDVNGDGMVNIDDVVDLINKLLVNTR